MEKAIIYARVSTKEQAEEGFSLASQIKLLREYASNQVQQIVKEFVVPESASGRMERTTFKEMMTYSRKHNVNHILCEKVDRITRNLQDAVLIDSWLQGDPQRRVHFVKQNLVIHQNAKSYEKFQWDIYVVLARQYSNNLSEETKKGLVEKAQEGWFPGSTKRGYTSVGERGHKVWEIDQSESSEAQFIQKAFELYGHGDFTLATVRDILFEQGWATPSGNKIARGIIHLILRDPFYCGRFVWNGKEYQGKHEPLISEETYELVQKKLRRALKSGKARKHSFLYAGLFRCAGCGSAVCAELQKGHIYYRCTRYKPCTQKKATREETITGQILRALDALKISWPNILDRIRVILKESHESEKVYHEGVMKELNDQFNRVKGRIDVLYDDRADGRISKEFYDEKLAQYEKQQGKVVRKIARHKERSIDFAKTANDILYTSQQARELFEEIEPDDKRALFKFILGSPRLDNGEVVFDYQKPFDKVHEIATFQPQKSLMNTGQIGLLLPPCPDVLRQEDVFPEILSIDEHAKFLLNFLGVIEYPQRTSELAAYFASMKLPEDHTLAVAA